MRCRHKLSLILIIIILAFSILPVASASITYYTNCYLPLNDYGTYIRFDEQKTMRIKNLVSIIRENFGIEVNPIKLYDLLTEETRICCT